MELTAAEGRVLGCLIEHQQQAGPEAPAASLDEIRFACNQVRRRELTAFDDRAVDDALLSLKSKGLARFVVAGHGVGPVRYRHRADDRWRLNQAELAVLSVLLLGGPQRVAEVRDAVDGDDTSEVETALDSLAGRTPTPIAVRISSTAWAGETLWAEVLTGRPSPEELHRIATPVVMHTPPAEPAGRSEPYRPNVSLGELADRLTKIERRLAGIEAAIAALRTGQESSRMIR